LCYWWLRLLLPLMLLALLLVLLLLVLVMSMERQRRRRRRFQSARLRSPTMRFRRRPHHRLLCFYCCPKTSPLCIAIQISSSVLSV
jgi:ABC-type Fe3+ transport system permease subunit